MTIPIRPGGIPDETWRAYLMVKARMRPEVCPWCKFGHLAAAEFDAKHAKQADMAKDIIEKKEWTGRCQSCGQRMTVQQALTHICPLGYERAFDNAASQADGRKPLNIRDAPSGVGHPTSFDKDGIGRSIGDDGTVHLWRWIGAVGQWGSIVYIGPEQGNILSSDERAFDDAVCQADNPASAKVYEENVNTFLDEFVSPHRRLQQHDLLSRAIREAAMSYNNVSRSGLRTWVHLSPEEQARLIARMRWAIKRYHEIMGSELGR